MSTTSAEFIEKPIKLRYRALCTVRYKNNVKDEPQSCIVTVQVHIASFPYNQLYLCICYGFQEVILHLQPTMKM